MMAAGQLALDGAAGTTPRQIPAVVVPVEESGRRANVVRLLLNGAQERRLRRLADAAAKLHNELNYERRQRFFTGERIDFNSDWRKYYERYKGILGAMNTVAVIRACNAE